MGVQAHTLIVKLALFDFFFFCVNHLIQKGGHACLVEALNAA